MNNNDPLLIEENRLVKSIQSAEEVFNSQMNEIYNILTITGDQINVEDL